jgi:hypothetical protein
MTRQVLHGGGFGEKKKNKLLKTLDLGQIFGYF